MRAACLSFFENWAKPDVLHRDALTVNGQSIWENVAERPAGIAT